MELFTPEFFTALAAIIVIDLALAGDNAIVIALAARNLPPHLQRRAILWGTFGAIAVRVVMTMAVVWLLGIPGLMAAGGAILVWIAYKLLKPAEGAGHEVKAAATFWGAMQTIVIADAAMGLDNVLAVAGAAHGSFALVVIGLLISIPIVVWGSTLILKWVERYPWIVQVGVAVLAWTAAKMIVSEPLFKDWFDANAAARIGLYVFVFAAVFGLGFLAKFRHNAAALQEAWSPERHPHQESAMKRILVPVDGSAQGLAAVKAAIAAGRSAVERIDLVHVTPTLTRHAARFVPKAERDGWREERARAALDPARRLVESAGIACRTHVARGPLASTLADTARLLGVHEIVLAATKRGPLAQFLAHPLSTRLIESASVPVRVVPAATASPFERLALPTGVAAGFALVVFAIED